MKKIVFSLAIALVLIFVVVMGADAVTRYSRFYAVKVQGPDTSYTGAILVNDSTGTEKFSVTSSGVVTVDGYILTKEPVTELTATTTLTSSQSGGVFSNEGASAGITLNLPPAATGLTFTVVNADTNPYTLNINPDDSDRIYKQTNADGDSIESDAAGESVTLTALDEYFWQITATSLATDWPDSN